MAEFKVKIWRRTEPLFGDKTKIKNLERDEVSLEAPNQGSALRQVMDAERKENGSRVRIYVRIDTPGDGHEGQGDYTLCELAYQEKYGTQEKDA